MCAAPGRGRPRKFGRPARSITITLPEDVIERLRSGDGDVARAIVELVGGTAKPRRRERAGELVSFGRRSVILVPPVRVLRRLRGVQLVPVGGGRCLIALDPPHAIAGLELGLRDLLEDSTVNSTDRAVLESVVEILGTARHSHRLTIAEPSIIVLERR